MSVRAVYQNGMFRLDSPLELEDGSKVELAITKIENPEAKDQSARKFALERLESGYSLGGVPLSHDESHAR